MDAIISIFSTPWPWIVIIVLLLIVFFREQIGEFISRIKKAEAGAKADGFEVKIDTSDDKEEIKNNNGTKHNEKKSSQPNKGEISMEDVEVKKKSRISKLRGNIKMKNVKLDDESGIEDIQAN